MELRRVETKDVADTFVFAAPYLYRALRHDNGESSLDEIREELLAGELDLWLVYSSEDKQLFGAVTTGFVKYPLHWNLELRTVTVDTPREAWLELFPVLEDYAAYYGCEQIEVTGRLGLEKLMPIMGFKKTHVKMTKVVGQ